MFRCGRLSFEVLSKFLPVSPESGPRVVVLLPADYLLFEVQEDRPEVHYP